jgi:hypothetical protein
MTVMHTMKRIYISQVVDGHELGDLAPRIVEIETNLAKATTLFDRRVSEHNKASVASHIRAMELFFVRLYIEDPTAAFQLWTAGCGFEGGRNTSAPWEPNYKDGAGFPMFGKPGHKVLRESHRAEMVDAYYSALVAALKITPGIALSERPSQWNLEELLKTAYANPDMRYRCSLQATLGVDEKGSLKVNVQLTADDLVKRRELFKKATTC